MPSGWQSGLCILGGVDVLLSGGRLEPHAVAVGSSRPEIRHASPLLNLAPHSVGVAQQ